MLVSVEGMQRDEAGGRRIKAGKWTCSAPSEPLITSDASTLQVHILHNPSNTYSRHNGTVFDKMAEPSSFMQPQVGLHLESVMPSLVAAR